MKETWKDKLFNFFGTKQIIISVSFNVLSILFFIFVLYKHFG